MKAKKILANLLLTFVLISIGYALGKEMTLRSVRSAAPGAAPATAPSDEIVVYYFHGTIRCVTCNAIEKMTREVVHRDYNPQVQHGKIRWKIENFQENETLAKRYDISTSSVVISRLHNGHEVAFDRLDKVWQLAHNAPRFEDYIRQSIDGHLKGARP